jgi:hypothetical protein
MDRTVKEHIEELEKHRTVLNVALMSDDHTLAQRNQIESEIRAVTMAIEYFHAALLAEANLSTKKMVNRG